MKQLFISLNFILCLSLTLNTFSQELMNKSDVKKLAIEFKINQRQGILSDRKPYFNELTNYFIDSLKKSLVDTIGICKKSYVGSISNDPCNDCAEIPCETYIHWKKNNEYFQALITECCRPEIINISASTIIGYYINQTDKLEKEFIFPVIRKDIYQTKTKELIIIGIDHTVNYLIYCIVNEKKYATYFTEYELEENENIFFFENNESSINSWRKLIENQIAETERK